ncbi:hypothetical protein [Nonomuraea jabiensis]|uniref:hypothetical protein n=1 Tax=Nonomuraea jabiensis TaxID=882448 RepID=UPI003D75F0DE
MLTIPVDRIEQRARQANAGRALKTAVVAIPYAIGWAARKTWMGLAYGWTAIAAGWEAAGEERPVTAQRDRWS